MYSRLSDVKNGKINNHILPFLWMKGEDISKTLRQLYRAHEAGIGAVCLESRTFEDFGCESWWKTVGTILEEAEKLNMKVWILDDKHFPTGYANGLIASKYPEKRPLSLCERHIDVMGPRRFEWILRPFGEGDRLIAVVALSRTARGEKELSDKVFISFDVPENPSISTFSVPEGCWRVFALWETRCAGNKNTDRIDMMSKESCRVQLEAVYEPHYEHFSKYFGNTLAGFFSDEPCVGSDMFMGGLATGGFYDGRCGQKGRGMPWHHDMLKTLAEKLNVDDVRPFLPFLWFEGDISPELRIAYMDTAADRYAECFTETLGNWCREHKVEYIGHIIEDCNAHTTLMHSAPHYFRALGAQDMAGMDIVLHQVMPGFGEYDCACSNVDVAYSSFYHYSLPKLASSLADINPAMRGRAMCEVFGAYGWAEGVSMMKWLIDFLLVRGINHFVPHAFSPVHPNPDCPPHFDADGTNPQFDDFGVLMRYTNKAAELLSGRRVNRLAVLYHAEADWSRRPYTNEDDVAVELTDNHIDFDIVPSEKLSPAAEDGRLHVGNAVYDAVIVPYAECLGKKTVDRLNSLGVPVFETDALTEGLNAEIIPLGSLSYELEKKGFKDIFVEGDNRLLRVGHYDANEAQVFMMVNEYANRTVDCFVRLPVRGSYLYEDILGGREARLSAPDGRVHLRLAPGESCILIFDGEDEPETVLREYSEGKKADPVYRVETADCESLDAFVTFAENVRLGEIPALPSDFGGKIRYTTRLNLSGVRALRLVNVSDTACMSINGGEPIRRIAEPFVFDVEGNEGECLVEITVSTTLAHRFKDELSSFMPISTYGFDSLEILR